MKKNFLLRLFLLSLTSTSFIFANNNVQANWFNRDFGNTKPKRIYKPKRLIRRFPRNLEISKPETPWISKSLVKTPYSESNSISPSQVGDQGIPFTTSLVKSGGPFKSSRKRSKDYPSSAYPFLSTGLVNTYINLQNNCTGALIGPGLVLTSASCFYDYGHFSGSTIDQDIHETSLGSQMAFIAYFLPGHPISDNTVGPIGYWLTKATYINRNYLNGTCSNSENYTSCNLAILILDESAYSGDTNELPSDFTSPYKYAKGYGFSLSNTLNAGNKKIGQITTIGLSQNIGEKSRTTGLDLVRNDSVAIYYKPVRNEPHLLYGSNALSSLTSYEGQGSPIIANFGTTYKHPFFGKANKSQQNILVGMQTICDTQDTCIGLRFDVSSDFPLNAYKDDADVNWGPGHIGYAMREICGEGYNSDTYSDYCTSTSSNVVRNDY